MTSSRSVPDAHAEQYAAASRKPCFRIEKHCLFLCDLESQLPNSLFHMDDGDFRKDLEI
jgi:hypothetical protein